MALFWLQAHREAIDTEIIWDIENIFGELCVPPPTPGYLLCFVQGLFCHHVAHEKQCTVNRYKVH